jgi:ketosteroid isomerase-like protein
MGVGESIAAVRRFYAVGRADDDSGRPAFASPDIVWHVPGANRVSGEYRGLAEVFGGIGAAMEPLDRWEVDVVDVMANREYVMATVELRAERLGRSVESRGGHLFRLDAEGRIVEAWGFVADQDGLDALLDPAPDRSSP